MPGTALTRQLSSQLCGGQVSSAPRQPQLSNSAASSTYIGSEGIILRINVSWLPAFRPCAGANHYDAVPPALIGHASAGAGQAGETKGSGTGAGRHFAYSTDKTVNVLSDAGKSIPA